MEGRSSSVSQMMQPNDAAPLSDNESGDAENFELKIRISDEEQHNHPVDFLSSEPFPGYSSHYHIEQSMTNLADAVMEDDVDFFRHRRHETSPQIPVRTIQLNAKQLDGAQNTDAPHSHHHHEHAASDQVHLCHYIIEDSDSDKAVEHEKKSSGDEKAGEDMNGRPLGKKALTVRFMELDGEEAAENAAIAKAAESLGVNEEDDDAALNEADDEPSTNKPSVSHPSVSLSTSMSLSFSRSFGGDAKPPPKQNPLQHAGMLSRVFYSFVRPILDRGYHHGLTEADLDEPCKDDKASVLYEGFQQAMTDEIEARKHTKRWGPIVFRAVFRLIGLRFLFTSFLLIPYSAAKIAQPLLLREIVKFIADESRPYWTGFVYALLLTLTALINTFIHHQYFFLTPRIGMEARIGVSTAVFQKALRLRNSAIAKTTSGQLVNLIANDAGKFDDAMIYLNYLWNAPLEALATLILLYFIIGYSAFFGFAILVLLCPLQVYFTRKFAAYRRNTIQYTDVRVKTVNEILNGVEIVKLYNWELPLENVVFTARKNEFSTIFQAAMLKAYNQGLFFSSTAVVCLVTFGSAWFLEETLHAADIFAVVALYNVVRLPLTNFIPYASEKLMETLVASRRLTDFLSLSEDDQPHLPPVDQSAATAALSSQNTAIPPSSTTLSTDALSSSDKRPAGSIDFDKATFVWDPVASSLSGVFDLNVRIKAGSLVAVVGSIGSSKSTFLSAVLGEMTRTAGSYHVAGQLSYSPQQAWIFAGTVRENIVFGRALNKIRYISALRACCLIEDLQRLHAGDQTMIGERGASLSGGQRARVALARAVYSDSSIYLSDDPLAAVDAIVARRLFDRVFSNEEGMLRGRTRILVTHQTRFLPRVDHIIILEKGHVKAQGSYEELHSDPSLHSFFDDTHGDDDDEETREQKKIEKEERKKRRAEKKLIAAALSAENKNKSTIVEEGASKERAAVQTKKDDKRIVQEEVSSQGTVSKEVYLKFFRSAGGIIPTVIVFFLMMAGQAVFIIADRWLAIWSSKDANEQRKSMYVGIYFMLCMLTFIFGITRAVLFFRLVLKGAAEFHTSMFRGVLYSSMRFFEANPVGRVLNRFAKDQSVVDELLPITFFDYIQCVAMTIGCLVVVGIASPIILLVLIPIVPIFIMVRRFYLKSSREIKRLDAVSRSPVYAVFSSALSGLHVIRAFGVQQQMLINFMDKIDSHTKAYFPFLTTARWFGLRLDLISISLILTTALVFVGTRSSVNPATAGFALSYVLQLTALFQWCVRQSAEVENHMTAAERILAYGQLPREGPWSIEETKPPKDWPQHGRIVFEDVKMKYRPELDYVLKGVELDIEAGSKVGVVGRTGAGKSSLFQVLFRLTEIQEGRILIDGVDIGKIGLHDLRSRLSIIPQNPVLFSGTLRYNLDPFNLYSDEQLWNALESVQLKETVKGLSGGLQAKMAEFGSNFSVGECQLICIARALLKPSKFLAVDEATASVDQATDDLIQSVIRAKFSDRTTMTIAHRLNTVADSDRVVVMDAGRVAEFGPPKDLLDDPSSIFSSMHSAITKPKP